jgi:hypothetical protein
MKGIEQLLALINEIEDIVIAFKEAYEEDDGEISTGEYIGISISAIKNVLTNVDTSELPKELKDLDADEIKIILTRISEMVVPEEMKTLIANTISIGVDWYKFIK